MEPRGNAAGLMPLCLSLPLVFSGGRKALVGRVSVRAATPGGTLDQRVQQRTAIDRCRLRDSAAGHLPQLGSGGGDLSTVTVTQATSGRRPNDSRPPPRADRPAARVAGAGHERRG